jgi:hypothetical protein
VVDIAVTSIGSWSDTASRSAFSCVLARAPEPSTLVLVSVLASDTAGTPVEPTGVIGVGETFSIVTSSVTYDPNTPGSETKNLSLWRALSAAPTASMITATFPNNAVGCCILVNEVSGVSKAGTNGSSAVSASATSRAENGSKLTVFVPSATSTSNGWFAVCGSDDTLGVQAARGWVASDSTNHLTPNSALVSTYTLLHSVTSAIWSRAGSGTALNHAGIVIELVADNPAEPASVSTAQWAASMGCGGFRMFQPRIRNEYWVEVGHATTTDPATDTREV